MRIPRWESDVVQPEANRGRAGRVAARTSHSDLRTPFVSDFWQYASYWQFVCPRFHGWQPDSLGFNRKIASGQPLTEIGTPSHVSVRFVTCVPAPNPFTWRAGRPKDLRRSSASTKNFVGQFSTSNLPYSPSNG